MNNYAFYLLMPYLYMFLGFAVFLLLLKFGIKAFEYTVDGTCFKGHGFSDFKKRENQRIKIYYSALHPQNSETAGKRNYMLHTVIFIIMCMVVTFGLCYVCDHLG